MMNHLRSATLAGAVFLGLLVASPTLAQTFNRPCRVSFTGTTCNEIWTTSNNPAFSAQASTDQFCREQGFDAGAFVECTCGVDCGEDESGYVEYDTWNRRWTYRRSGSSNNICYRIIRSITCRNAAPPPPPPPSFDIEVQASQGNSVTWGTTRDFSINLVPENGFSDTVTLEAEFDDDDLGITPTFSQNPVSISGPTTVTVSFDTVRRGSRLGRHDFSVEGVSGSLRRRDRERLVVVGVDGGFSREGFSWSTGQGGCQPASGALSVTGALVAGPTVRFEAIDGSGESSISHLQWLFDGDCSLGFAQAGPGFVNWHVVGFPSPEVTGNRGQIQRQQQTNYRFPDQLWTSPDESVFLLSGPNGAGGRSVRVCNAFGGCASRNIGLEVLSVTREGDSAIVVHSTNGRQQTTTVGIPGIVLD